MLYKTLSVTSSCLVVMVDSLEPGVQGRMMELCRGRRKCVALMVISGEEDIRQDPPAEELPVQQKFSLQTAWVVVKRLARGYMVRLSCRGRSRLWLQYGSQVPEEIRRKTNHDLTLQIFEGLVSLVHHILHVPLSVQCVTGLTLEPP